MSQASKFKSKLALSAVAALFSSGAVWAQQVAEDKPKVTFTKPAEVDNNTASAPAKAGTSDASQKVAVKPVAKPHVKRKGSISANKATTKSESAPKEEEMKFAAPLPGEVIVSDRDYNHFIFSSPITQLVFPPNAPVVGKPTYLANNTQALIMLQRGADKVVQMVVETESGAISKLYLKPRPINGITYRAPGAREVSPANSGSSSAARPSSADGTGTPHGADIELLKRAVVGDIASDFESVALPRPTRFDRFTVVPLAGWSNGFKRIMQFSLVAVPGKTAVVASPQFYRQGITAVMLTGDHVDESNNPQLFVVEEVAQDE